LRVTRRPAGEATEVVKPPVSYVETSHRFLRFEGGTAGETVLLETSPDGSDDEVVFDNFNRTP